MATPVEREERITWLKQFFFFAGDCYGEYYYDDTE